MHCRLRLKLQWCRSIILVVNKQINGILILLIFLMKNQIVYRLKKFIPFCCVTAVGVIVLLSCNWSGNRNRKLKFNPPLNKLYHFSLTKYSTKSWAYQSVSSKIYDSVYINFSLQNIYKTDTSDICKFILESFVWKGKFKVNYHRDSLHALSTKVVLSDSGKVESVQDMNAILQDIENDSATGRYLKGLIPDQVSKTAITDMLTRIFSVIPTKKVAPQDIWISNITLTTKHPVNFSNFNVLRRRNGDTAAIEIHSNIFSRLSRGNEFYIKGNQDGKALINYQTGIPYWYQTQSETVTTTNYYDIDEMETFFLIEQNK